MKTLFTLICSLTITITCAQVDHTSFDQLLKSYVNSKGEVNYKGLQMDSVQLNEYITMLASNSPKTNWSQNETLSYWINAYNAVTLQLILKYYPIKSIKDIGSYIQIPYFNTPWDIDLFTIDGQVLSLNNIEHDMIRSNFDEPRIHFALVCAAVSCPNLRNEAYSANGLEQQLADQTRVFLADTSKNIITENRLTLSKLFSWYGGDFTKQGSIVEFVKSYTEVSVSKKAKIGFMDYHWLLNEQKSE